MKNVRLAIVGGRDFQDYELLKRSIDELCKLHEVVTIVSGGATGADTLGERYAKEKGLNTIIHKPEWDRYGRSAGFRRNRLIVKDSDVVAAFWDGASRGTKSTIDLAEEAGLELHIFNY